ncbi:MAG: TrkH family potassium uptake protein [Paludibacteraceae bacterium]
MSLLNLKRAEINFKLVFQIIGKLLLVESLVILSVLSVSLFYGEKDGIYFLLTAGICLAVGLILAFANRKAVHTIGKREGAIMVTATWVVFSLAGALPFWLSGAIPSYTDAFFETMSGFTTTGASILNNIEELSYGMLFWRSMTHWLGGLGIIVISMAILPILGVNGAHLFVSETTGPTKEKFSPKLNDTARILLIVYVSLTVVETILLKIGGLSLFDAVTHSFATIATGGFSTKQASIAYWGSSTYVQYVISIFMLLAGINFAMYFFAYKRNFKKIWKSEELRGYLSILFVITIIITFSLIDFSENIQFANIEKAFRDSFFTVSSLITTTGFATVDYTTWKPFTLVLIVIIMIIGGSAGSTAGGIKVVRIMIAAKTWYYEFKRLIHPSAIIPIKYNNYVIKDDVHSRVMGFILLYFFLIFIGTMILLLSGMGIPESIGSMLSCLSCVGPGFGSVGPVGNFSAIPEFSKWFLSFIMLVGRLELYTVLMIFTPAFWK